MTLMHNLLGPDGMAWAMGVFVGLNVLVLVLAIVALIKYIFFG
jgi:uncharacterized membrane protein